MSQQPQEAQRVQAMKWWNTLGLNARADVMDKYPMFNGRTHSSLTGREIETIYVQEAPDNKEVQKYCDAMGHYGGEPIRDGICPKCGKTWKGEVQPSVNSGEEVNRILRFYKVQYETLVKKPDDTVGSSKHTPTMIQYTETELRAKAQSLLTEMYSGNHETYIRSAVINFGLEMYRLASPSLTSKTEDEGPSDEYWNGLTKSYGKTQPYHYNGPKCVMGCKNYSHYETKHHPDCPFYKGSFSEQFDLLQQAKTEPGKWVKELAKIRNELYSSLGEHGELVLTKELVQDIKWCVNDLDNLMSRMAESPHPTPEAGQTTEDKDREIERLKDEIERWKQRVDGLSAAIELQQLKSTPSQVTAGREEEIERNITHSFMKLPFIETYAEALMCKDLFFEEMKRLQSINPKKEEI